MVSQKGENFKISGEELILDILELQIKHRSQEAIAFLTFLKGSI